MTMFAQTRTVFIQESFDSDDLPAGWSIQGFGESSWSIAASANAGGTPNELFLYYNPSFDGISRIVMNPVDLTGISDVVVSFKHYLDNYSGESKIGIATSSNGGNTWNIGWEQTYNMTGGANINQNISTPDMGKDNVLFCLFYEGNSYNVNGWYFDDFEIYLQEELDLKLLSIDIPEIIPTGETEIVFTVQNVGKTTVSNFDVTVNVTGWDEPVTATVNQTIGSLATKQIAFSYISDVLIQALPQDSYYNINVEIEKVNGEVDDNTGNNVMNKDVFAAWGSTQRITMIEHFTSSTCGPCVSVNYTMNQLTTNNPGKFTYTKYQMNWPGNGDAYYTQDGEARRVYYACDAVPTVIFNGGQINASLAQSLLEMENNNPAYTNISGAFNIDGNTINITADFMSYIKLENVAAFVSVNEKETTGNVGSNGETSFNHVMMKLLDSADGNTISINAGEYKRLEFSFDMSSTHVEDMNDLEVALWLQDFSTKEMYNSHFAYEYTEHAYPVQNHTMTADGNDLVVTWSAPEAGTPTGYMVKVNGEVKEANTTNMSYTIANAEGLNIAEVIALYDDKSSVPTISSSAAEDGGDGDGDDDEAIEELNNSFVIYPNPVKDLVMIQGNDINSVSVYNSVGVLVERIDVRSNEVEINMNDYNTGIYFVQVNTENGTATRKVVKL